MNKKLLTLGLTAFFTISSAIVSFSDTINLRFVDTPKDAKTVVIRVGEYKNKPGKRIQLPVGVKLNSKYELTDNNELCEFEINEEIAESIASNLRALNPNLNVIVQYAKSSWSDLNMAGKLALQNENVEMYLSIHSNAHDNPDTNGYLFLTGKGSTYKNNLVAERLSNSISENGLVNQRKNNYNVTYIGELNETTSGCISVLFESGYFTNLSELMNITSDEYIDYVGENLSYEINEILTEK